jgi:pyridoxamine 5'-phosphate oxidase
MIGIKDVINGLPDNPVQLFEEWLRDAEMAALPEYNAMILATVSPEQVPDARVVLLKSVSNEGFVFYTNYSSVKSMHLLVNPTAALVFFWPQVERQVRVTGKVMKTSSDESDAYFRSRPEGSKIGAWASPQSRVIPDRNYLDNLVAECKLRFKDEAILRPDHWGGYRLDPLQIEFWKGRPDRLHDRFLYVREGEQWIINRLAP